MLFKSQKKLKIKKNILFQSRDERRKFRGDGASTAQRRAQSEGPGIRNPLFRDDGNDLRPAVIRGGNLVRSTENAPVHSRRERSAPSKEPQVCKSKFKSFNGITLGHTRLSDYNKQMLAITKETI
jgi:hypothetical protein